MTTKAFGIAELIRHISYNAATDKVETSKKMETSGASRSNTKSAGGTNAENLVTFAKATYRSAIFKIQATQGSNYHTTTFVIIHDGSTTYDTEFATVRSGSSLFSVTSDVSGNNVRIRTTAANANTTYKYSVEYVEA
jgi:hypothetical protein